MKSATRIVPVLTALLCSLCCAAAEPTTPASVPSPAAPAAATAPADAAKTADAPKAAIAPFPHLPVGYTHAARFSLNPPVPDHKPIPVYEVQPKYPEELKATGKPGYAIIVLLVDEYGNPQEIQCTEASDRLFARATEKAIAKWGFIPALKRQQAVYGSMTLRVEFRNPTTINFIVVVPAK